VQTEIANILRLCQVAANVGVMDTDSWRIQTFRTLDALASDSD
jgi:hypothetical protein